FRMAQFTVELPAVRTLPDRNALVRALWAQLGDATGGVTLAPESVDLLARYDWPGNYRQLVGTLRALRVLSEPGRPLPPDFRPVEIRQARPPLAAAGVAMPAADGRTVRLDEVTRETMRQALETCRGNVSETARRLGINRSTLYRRLLNEAPEG